MGDMADLYDCIRFVSDEDPDEDPDEVTCKYCGEAGLYWDYSGVRWRLRNADGKIHVCPRVASEDDFEDVT